MRRAMVALIGVGLLASLVALQFQRALGQVKPAPPGAPIKGPTQPVTPPPPDAADLPGATLPTDPKLKRKLEAVEDYIKHQDWGQVAKTVQDLLDLPQDVFVQVMVKDALGKEKPTLVGIRVAANRLLGTMPRNRPGEGIDVYNTLHGANARKILQEALASGEKQLFADVAHRYLYTDAGGEAAERLGTLLLDRGDFTASAQAFERLLMRDNVEKLEPISLYKAALAFHRSGDKEGREKVWKQLIVRAPEGLRVAEQTIGLGELQNLLDRYRPSTVFAYDHPQFGGNESRNAQSMGGAPFMVRRWYQMMTTVDQVKGWVYDGPTSAVKRLEERGHAVLPSLFPVASTMTRPRDGKQVPVLVYRTYEGLSAVDLKTGKLEWRSPSAWSLEKMYADSYKSPALHQWITFWKDQNSKPHLLLENSTLGTLSTDGNRVYAVEDLALPPSVLPQYDPRMGFAPGGGQQSGFYNQQVNEAMQHNKLQAIELSTGKLKWELGGKRPATEPERKDPRDFLDTFFLGPPLCLGGRLYFLNEKQQDLRLVCFDPNRVAVDGEQEKRDAVVWVQTLCTAKDKMQQDYVRRTNAAHIAFGEGILVCPTNAGVLLGVDVLSHSLVWAHPYRDPTAGPATAMTEQERVMMMAGVVRTTGRQPTPAAVVQSDWKTAAPIIADGRVVFTAPDGSEIRCLNLRSGVKAWGLKRGDDDLYLAGVWSGRAVVVGKKAVRGLGLEDGKELWRVETGVPSGRGVACDNIYYVPLKEFTFPDKAKGPAVVAVDIEKGKIVSQTRSRPNPETKVPAVPGNLVFFDGDVISQNASEVVAYPQLVTKLRTMDELLAQDAKNPKGLFERGELRLDQGNRLGAVEDLREALANGAPPEVADRAKAKMFEAMTELLQHDYKNGKKFLKDYEALCKAEIDPLADMATQAEQKAEGQRRRANYLALYAKGTEGEGNLVEAFTAYLEYAALGTQEMLPVVDEVAVRAPADVWARGRIAAMLAAARPEQREPLEKAIAARFTEARDTGDLDKLRNFVTLFGSSLALGREARLQLAERLIDSEAKTFLLEAERHLLLLEQEAGDRPMAARAVDALARLLTRLAQVLERPEMYEDAAHYYRVLRDRYGDVVVRDGKTGAQLHQELASDRRFLLYMEEPAPPRNRKVKGGDETGSFPQGPQHYTFTFEPVGEALPYFRRHRVAVNYSSNHFEMDDRRNPDARQRWSEQLRVSNLGQFVQYMANANSAGQGVRFGYQSVGHLLVLNLGTTLIALDPINRKVLWEKSLFGAQGPPSGNSLTLDTDGTLRLNFPDNHFLTLGQAGPVAASYVCVQTREGLTALDPITGRALWLRADVPSRCRIFGDDAHVYLVEMDHTGTPTNTRAFRAHDGAAVVVPNFATQYKARQRVIGRTLLTSETNSTTGLTLKLYDVHTGKDLWSKTYPVGSVLLRSEEPDLAGAISPEGRASVVSLLAQREVVVGLVDPKDLQNVQAAHLLSDGDLVYVAFHGSNANQANFGASIQSNLQMNTGLRGLTVNGKVYAFDRRTSKIKWFYEVQNQQLVLEQWKEMPVLLFTGRYHKVQNLGGGRWVGGGNLLVAVDAVIKASGKRAFNREDMGQQTGQFYALTNDTRSGKIELISHNYKVTYTIEDNPAAKEAKPASGGSGGR